MTVNAVDVFHAASVEVVARLRAADLAALEGYPDIADELRRVAARWAELEQREMST